MRNVGIGAKRSASVGLRSGDNLRARRFRGLLLGSSALIGIGLAANPAAAQTANPAGGGTITTASSGATVEDNTPTGGGIRYTNVAQGNEVTVNGVTINQTVDGPTTAALSIEGSVGTTGVAFNGASHLTTTVSGNAAFRHTSTGNAFLGFLSSGSVFTGSYGIDISAPNSFVQVDSTGYAQSFIANGSAIAGIRAASGNATNILTGGSTFSGFATGISATSVNNYASVTTTGGSIDATQEGIYVSGPSANVNSQSVITARTGIHALGSTDTTVTTSGAGTIDSVLADNGTGIAAATSGGSGATTVNVGAAVGGTTPFAIGVSAMRTGTATGAINVTTTAAVTGATIGILLNRNSTPVTANTVSIGADVTGGTGIDAFNAATTAITVNAGATVTGNSSSTTGLWGFGSAGIMTNSSLASVNNSGTIRSTGTSAGNAGVMNLSGATTTNNATGVISGRTGVYDNSSGITTNAGTITGTGTTSTEAAVRKYGGTLTNTGTITGAAVGVLNGGSFLTINNTGGTITGATNGIEMPAGVLNLTNTGTVQTAGGTAGAGLAGVYLNVSTGVSQAIINSGTISGGSDATHGFGVDVSDGPLSLTNQSGGNITGGTGGIRLANDDADSLSLNAGSTVTGQILSSNSGARTVTLAGTLTGNYNAGSGTGVNTFTLASTGSMQGATFGNADDVFAFMGGTINGVVNAGAGADTFNSVLGAGNSATVSLSNLTAFEAYNHVSGTLTLSGSRASGIGWNVTSGASVTLSGALTTSGYAFSINGNTSGSVFQILSGGSIGGTSGVFFNGGPSATFNNAGTISVTGGTAVLTNGTTAMTNTGTLASSAAAAISTGFGVTSLVNSGLVSGGTTSFGISSQYRGMTITNQAGGFITGGSGAILGGISGNGGTLTVGNASGAGIAGPTAISIIGQAGLALTNSGQVVGGTNAVNATGTLAVTITNNVGGVIATGTLASAAATYVAGGTGNAINLPSGTVTNSGTIDGAAGGLVATGALTLTNTGTITSHGTGTGNFDGVTATGSATVLNSGTITGGGYAGIYSAAGGTFTNAAAGHLVGANSPAMVLDGGGTFNNYGSATNGGGAGVGGSGATINLFAGSTTGSVQMGGGNDTLAIYNGRGASGAATVDAPSGITLQNAGTLSAASFGAVDLGGGTNTLMLRGTGDDTAANGTAGVFSIATSTGASILTKADAGTWTLFGPAITPAITINAGTGGVSGSGGLLVFNGTTGLTGTINVNGGAIRATSAGAFGTGTIHAIDPTIQFGATGTYSNDISLDVGSPASSDPTILQTDAGVTATLTGLITRGAGDANQYVTIDGPGTVVLANTGNAWTGVTAINSGATLQGATNTISGGSVANAGTLVFSQAVDGTFAKNISGAGVIKINSPAHTVTLSGTNSYTGQTSILAGTLIASGGSAIGDTGAVDVASGSEFQLASNETIGGLSGAGTTRLLANTLTLGGNNISTTFSGSITDQTSGGVALGGGLTKAGTGTFTLSGTNNYTGLTSVLGGTLELRNSAAIADTGTVTVTSPGALLVTNSETIGNLNGTGNTSLTGALTIANGSGTYSGAISGSGGLIERGTSGLAFNGAITTTGQVELNGTGALMTIGGTRSGANNSGVLVSGANAGLTVAATGAIQGGQYLGVRVSGAGDTVTNLGSITNTGTGGDSGYGAAIGVASTGGTTIITNGSVGNSTATISGQNGGINHLGSGGVLATGLLTVNNYGTIAGNLYNGIENQSGTGALTVSNYGGTIVGQGNAGGGNGLSLVNSTLTLTNTGRIVGRTNGIYTGSAVSITNSGTIASGTLSGGASGTLTAGGSEGIYVGNGTGGMITNQATGVIQGGFLASTNAIHFGANGGTIDNSGQILGIALNSSSTAATFGAYFEAGAGSVTNRAGGVINGGSSGLLMMGGGSVTNSGTITSNAYGAIDSHDALTVYNLTGGLLSGASGVVMTAGGGSVTNGATIQGKSLAGVYATSSATVTNTGTIETVSGATGHAVRLIGGGTVTNNSGGIIRQQSTTGGSGVYADAALDLTNTGTISTASATGNGVTSVATLTLTNNAGGTISGGTAGVYANTTTGTTTITNYGSITNSSAANDTSHGAILTRNAATITNNGTIGGVNGIVTKAISTVDNYGTIAVAANGNGMLLIGGGTATNRLGGTITATQSSDAWGMVTGTVAAGTLVNDGRIDAGSGMISQFAGTVLSNTGTIAAQDAGLWAVNVGLNATNSGTITKTATGALATVTGVRADRGGVFTNSGTISGVATGVSSSGAAINLTNNGSISGSTAAITLTGAFADTVTFGAASTTTGAVNLGDGADTLTILAGATTTDLLDGGAGTDGLVLGGATTASFNLANLANFETLTKTGGNIWTLTGASASPAARINAGDGGAGTDGTLAFNNTTGLTGDIYVNGAAIRAETAGAFGSGTIYAMDPTIQFGATGTYANNIVLNSGNTVADPTLIQADNGVTATLSGTITEQNPPQPLVFGVTGGAGSATVVLANDSNAWTGSTTINSGMTLQGTTASISGSSIVDNGGLVYDQATNGTIAQAISGTGTLTKQGAGTVTITQANSYSGNTSVLAGTLVAQNTTDGFGTGDLSIASGATAQYDNQTGGAIFVHGGTITGAGTLLFTTGAGSVTALGNNGGNVNVALSQGGLIDVEGAGTVLGSTSGQGFWTNNRGSLNIGTGATFNGVEGNIIVDALTGSGTLTGGYAGGGSTTVGIAGGSGTFSGIIADNGSPLVLIKEGAGTQTLSGANTYTGLTTINGGTLALAGGNAIADGNTVQINAAGTLSLLSSETLGSIGGSGAIGLGANTLTLGTNNLDSNFAGVISGNGGLTKVGTGTLTLSGLNTYLGLTQVQAGTLRLGADNVLDDNSSLEIWNGATLDLNGYTDTVSSFSLQGTVTGGGLITAQDYHLYGAVVNQALGGGLLYQESGTSLLNGTAAATTVQINGGTLQLGASDRLNDAATVTVNAGTAFDLQSFSDAVATLNLSGSLNGTGTLTATDYNLTSGTVNGNLGSGTLTQVSGTSLLNGTAGAGVVNVNGGTLQLGASDRLNDAAVVSVATGTTLDLGANSDTVGMLFLNGTLAGTGTLTADQYQLSGATVDANLGAGTVFQVGGTSVLNGTAAGALELWTGTLRLGASDRLSDSNYANVSAGAALDMGAFDDTVDSLTLAGTLDGTGTLSANTYVLRGGTANANLGAGTLTVFSGTSTLNGTSAATTVQILGGTLSLGASDRLADAANVQISSGGVLDLGANSDTVGALSIFTGALNGAGTLTAANYYLNDATVNANLGAGSLSVSSGINLLNGTSGATNIDISGGTLRLGGSDRLADGASILVENGTTLDLQGYSDTIANADLQGTLDGSGTLTAANYRLSGATVNANLGTGTLNQQGAASILNGTSAASTVRVTIGKLTLGAGERLSNNAQLIVGAGTTFDMQGFNETVGTVQSGGTLNGTGTLTAASYLLVGGTVNANLGAGTLNQSLGTTVLNGSSAANTVTIDGGTLQLGASERLADTAALNVYATLDMGAFNETVGSLALAGTLNGTGTLNASTYDLYGGTANANLGAGTLVQHSFTSTLNGTAGAATVTISGGTLRLGASNRLNDAAAVNVASGATLDLGANSDTVATLALSGNLDGTGSLTAGQYQLNDATVNANLGAGTLYQLGGTSVLNGTAGSSSVAVQAGTLRLGASDRLADIANVAVSSGAVLDMGAFSDTVGALTLGGTLNGMGTLTAAEYDLIGATVNANLGGGTLNQVGGTSTLNGTSGSSAVSVQQGTLRLGASNRLANTAAVGVFAGATLDLGANSDTVNLLALNGTLAGTGQLTASQYQLTNALVNGNLGAGTLFQLGGTSVLNGTAGAASVQVQGGTLRLGASNRLADNAAVSVSAGTTLDLGAFNDTVGALGLNGTLAGTGTLTAAQYQLTNALVNANLGAGTLFQLGGTSVLNGTAGAASVQVQAGTLALGAANRLADTANVVVASGATLDLAGFSDTVAGLALGGTLNGSGTLTASEYDLTGATVNANLGGGTLFQMGGTSTLNGASGASQVGITGGTLALGASNRLADAATVSVSSGATLDLGAFNDTVNLFALSGTLNGTGTLTANNSYQLNGGTVNANLGSGFLYQIGGTSTLNGTSGSSTISIQLGTLRLGASNRLADAATVSVNSGATLDLGGFNEAVGIVALNGTLAGTGTLTASQYQLNGGVVNANLGAGTLYQLGGSSVLNGSAGATQVSIQAGTLALGASNRLLDTATVLVSAGATLDMRTFDDTVGFLALSGTLNGTGTLTASQYQLNGATVNANLGAGRLYQLGGTSFLNGTVAADPVVIQAGTLKLGASDRLADTASVSILAGATLDIGSFNDTVGIVAIAGTLNGTAGQAPAGTAAAAGTETDLVVSKVAVDGGAQVPAGTVIADPAQVPAATVSADPAQVALATEAPAAGSRIGDLSGVSMWSGATLGSMDGRVSAAGLEGGGAASAPALVAADTLDGDASASTGASQIAAVTAASAPALVAAGTLDGGTSASTGGAFQVAAVTVAAPDAGNSQAANSVSALATGAGTLTASQYQLIGATVNANLGAGTLFQLGGTSVLNGTAGALSVLIQGGTLKLGASDRLADAATVVVNSGATLDMGAFNDTVGTLGLNGTLAGTGTLTASQYQLNGATVNANLGAGTLFQLGGVSTLNGAAGATTVLVNAGTLRIGADERLADGATLAIDRLATFDLAGHTDTIGALTNGANGGGTLALGAGRLTVGGTDADSGYSGQITGSGALDKVGAGRMTLAGDFVMTGALNARAGTLAFLGSSAGSMNVQGGTLIGQGSFVGALNVSSGTLSPGGLPSGTGSAVQPLGSFSAASMTMSGGTLALDVAGRSQGFASDTIRVTGTTALTGGTVNVTSLSPSSDYNFMQRYTVLQSGSLTGTFANGSTFAAVSADPTLFWRLRYDTANSVVLEVQKQIDFASNLPSGGSPNESAVGNALDGGAGHSSDEWAATLNSIAALTPEQRAKAYDSLSGEAIADMGTTSEIASHLFLDLLMHHRQDGADDGDTADAQQGAGGALSMLAMVSAGMPELASVGGGQRSTRSGGWFQAYGGEQHLRGLPGQASLTSEVAGLAGGYERQAGDFTIGIAGSGSSINGMVDSRASNIKGSQYQGALYADYDDGHAFAGAAATYYGGTFDSTRTLTIGSALSQARGRTDNKGYTLSANAGYRTDGPIRAIAQIGVSQIHSDRAGFTETANGGMALQVARATRDLTVATGELRIGHRITQASGYVEPYVSVGVRVNSGDLDALGSMRFSGAPTGLGAFTVEGARLSPVVGLLGAGLDIKASDSVKLGIAVEGAASDRTREGRASMRIRIGF